ncbi:MAG: ATP synthase subunit I [Pseudomonadales bacterium]|nr:ATP synthase subunit I [Pseudomonadales bacterium]
MTEAGGLLLCGLAGAGLGGLFYGGLWLTVRHLGAARHPGLRVLGSTLLRSAGALIVFAMTLRIGGAPATLALLVGFVVARIALAVRLPRRAGAPR